MANRDKDNLPDDVAESLLDALDVSVGRPPATLKARVMQRILDDLAGTAIRTVRAGEGEWAELIQGVTAKTLHDDGRVRTWLARLRAGACVPAHVHEGDEEILLLEGNCIAGGVAMEVGDYQFSPKGSKHGAMTTAGGCLLLLRSASPAAAHA